MSKTPCLHCGSSQVNHTFARIDGYIEIVTSRFNRVMSGWTLTHFFSRALDKGTARILWVLSLVGIISWNTDITKAPSMRAGVLWAEAVARGMSVRNVLLFGYPIDVYEVCSGAKRLVFTSLPIIGGSELEAIQWLDDKIALKKRLLEAGIPAPRGGGFTKWTDVACTFETLSKPVIIKPQSGSRGRHTTTHIYTLEELRTAWNVARQISRRVVMEEHLIGSVYRATAVDGAVVAVLRGDPPRVTGDGVHTISELVEIKNKNRHPRVSEVVLNAGHADFLQRLGYTFASVIPDGKTIDLLSKIGVSYGGMSAEVTSDTHPVLWGYLQKAAGVVVYPIVGFDFIIEDVSADPGAQRWGIIEANSNPFINLHHFPVEGVPVNVAAFVWDMVARTGRI